MAAIDLSLPDSVVAVASGPPELAARFAHRVLEFAGGLPLYVLSELPSPVGRWIPYRFERSAAQHVDRIRAELDGTQVRFVCVLLAPDTLFRPMRRIGVRLGGRRTVFFNENLDHFMPRAPSLPAMVRHLVWRTKDWIDYQFHPGGRIYTLAWRMRNLHGWRRPLLYRKALRNGRLLAASRPERATLQLPAGLPGGVTVVIPSRQGRKLLAAGLPSVMAEAPDQVVVVDNGSSDGTESWLATEYPRIEAIVEPNPMSFAAAVNRGIAHARYSHVCLLNNDMEIEPGFFAALRRAFDHRPGLFCATAQIFFPEGLRREETGKAVMPPDLGITDFPLRCPEPVEGENYSDVLYGSGGCSMYSTAMLRALGAFDESFTPAYVEDLEIGYRGWLAGGPTVFVADARVLHRHRATTSRYFAPEEIDTAVERNYFRFLAGTIASRECFLDLWNKAVIRNNYAAAIHEPPPVPMAALSFAGALPRPGRSLPAGLGDQTILALGSGEFARFPGTRRSGKPLIAVASCYAPFPLSHGGAVRMYNLMRRASRDFDQVLIYFSGEIQTPPAELREIATEVIVVRRRGTHIYPSAELPDVVQEFRSPVFSAVVGEVVRQWKPEIVQLEFTQLAQYARDCAPAKTILVEHDVTIDLYRQLLESASGGAKWEYSYQLARWEHFERAAWNDVSSVVVMSERDRTVVGAKAVVVANGVDTERFQPSADPPEPGRLLFIGSFAHLPNVMATNFFLSEVFGNLAGATLHIIAGANPAYYLNFYKDRVSPDLSQPGVELEAFVPDVRPAYRRAQIVIAPLLASAGTNIKILEAMAMGKAIVSTPAGIHGLDLEAGRDVVVVEGAAEMTEAIRELIASPERCRELGARARQTVCARYDWDQIAEEQRKLYDALRAEMA